MTAAFERALANAGPATTYREVHRAVRSFVAQMAREQVPQLEVTKSVDATARLFNGALTEDPAPYLVTYDGKRWVLDAGVIHGIPPARGGRSRADKCVGQYSRNTLAHGELRVTSDQTAAT